MKNEELKWTGERLVTSLGDYYFTFEHLHRYALAREISKDKIVLDIACGEGYGSFLMSEVASYVYGVDIDDGTIKHAKNKYEETKNNLCYKTGSTNEIPLPDNSVDVAVSFETIEHHDAHEQMMKEIKRVLKADGIFIISSPDKDFYDQIVPNNPFHVKELRLSEFKTLLSNFFKSCRYYQQCFVAGSLIVPIKNKPAGFTTYDGDYVTITNNLNHEQYFNKPYYILAVCSDIPPENIETASFFNGAKAIINERNKYIEKGRKQITKSTSYKLGNWIIGKFYFLRNKR
jgi:SAM-dependent methyltransferase